MSLADNSHDIESGLSFPQSPRLMLSASAPLPKSTLAPPVVLRRTASDPIIEKNVNRPRATNRAKLVNLVRNISSAYSRKSVALFYCNICMENNAESDGFSMSSCEKNHKFCTPCIQSLIKIQLADGATSFPCPLIGECTGHISDNEIAKLVDSGTYEKYKRMCSIKSNPDFRECPKCSHPTTGNKENPSIVCENCQESYCYFHSNAHPTMTCSQYSRQQLQQEKQSNAAIRKITRKCPQCGADTEKNGGCNHMTCQHCQENWCWICGRHMEYNHFDPANISGCPGQQFSDSFIFARGSVCCRNSLYYLSRGIALLPLAICGLVAGLIGFCVCLAGLVVTVPLMIYKKVHSDTWDSDLLLIPAYCSLVFFGGLFLLVLQVIWLPIALLTALCFIAKHRESENLGEYFFFPVALVMNSILRDDD